MHLGRRCIDLLDSIHLVLMLLEIISLDRSRSIICINLCFFLITFDIIPSSSNQLIAIKVFQSYLDVYN